MAWQEGSQAEPRAIQTALWFTGFPPPPWHPFYTIDRQQRERCRVKFNCEVLHAKLKTSLGRLPALGRMGLSLCLLVNLRLPVLHPSSIYPAANSFMLRAASRPSPRSSDRGGRRDWREAYLIVYPIKLPQFEASIGKRQASIWFGCGEETSLLCRRPARLSNSTYAWRASIRIHKGIPAHSHVACGHFLAS